jgi:hypothetical protein
MNMAPTSVAIAKLSTSHWRVLSGSFLLRRVRVNDGLCFLRYPANA